MPSMPFATVMLGACITSHPAASARPVFGLGALGQLRLPTDPIGAFTLTLDGLAPGSALQIETAAGAPVAWRVATGNQEVFSLLAYMPGSPLNNLTVKVRKGTAPPFFQPYRTQAVAIVGSLSLFISQTPDE